MYIANIQGVPKKTGQKKSAYNFACVWSFLMKFGYVLDIVRKFFHKNFQGSSSKNVRFMGKSMCFLIEIPPSKNKSSF